MDIKQKTEIQPNDVVKSRILVAQNIKRDTNQILHKLSDFFENASIKDFYAKNDGIIFLLPRKGMVIEGLSIKAITDLASIYGHLDYGIKIIKYNERIGAHAQAWCYDLQNNTSETRGFYVEFTTKIRESKNFHEESYKFIYANGMRRMRSCIENILPFWLTESFFKKIKKMQAYARPPIKRPNKPATQTPQTPPTKSEPISISPLEEWTDIFKEFDKSISQRDVARLAGIEQGQEFDESHGSKLQGILNALRLNEVSISDILEKPKVPNNETILQKDQSTDKQLNMDAFKK